MFNLKNWEDSDTDLLSWGRLGKKQVWGKKCFLFLIGQIYNPVCHPSIVDCRAGSGMFKSGAQREGHNWTHN